MLDLGKINLLDVFKITDEHNLMSNSLKVYLVGGAVRDTLLARPVSEYDYVVVGATPEQMLDFGFSQVGADFPVFLHPHTHDEYALARTERKSGSGYLGFSVHASPDVTLEDDLIRRDLTINAMAIEVVGLFDSQFKKGKFDKADIIDPHGGLQDLDNKKLRHVSNAFTEDPVRVLRLARFASRYAPLGFSIADKTLELVQKMRDDGELNHLVAERVWAETRKALMQDWGDVYFDSLADMGVLGTILPDFAQAIENNEKWQLAKNGLRLAHEFNLDEIGCFALICTVFPEAEAVHEFCKNLKVPKAHTQFASIFLTQLENLQQFNHLSSTAMFELLKATHALKQPATLQQLLTVSKIYQLAVERWQLDNILQALQPIGIQDVDKNLKGKAIGEAIEQLRLEKLKEIL